MTWDITIYGHDDLEGEQKETFEKGLEPKIRAFVADLEAQAGCNITSASVTTNTTGTIDVTPPPKPAESPAE